MNRLVVRFLPLTLLGLWACGDNTGPVLGSIRTSASGAPGGAAPTVLVTGPERFADTVLAGETLTDLSAGSYQFTAQPVGGGGHVYASFDTVQVVIDDDREQTVTFAYALASGVLILEPSGVPAGHAMAAVVTGPGPFVHAFTGPDTIVGIPAGDYLVTSLPIDSSGHTFVPPSFAQSVSVPASLNPVTAAVAYALSTGRTFVDITGLPAANPPDVTMTGPNGFNRVLTGSELLIQLAPGAYTLMPADIDVDGGTFAAPDTTITVVANRTPLPVQVDYSLATATVMIQITGLPIGTPASVQVTGGTYAQNLVRSDTLVGLPPGTYTVVADTVANGGIEFAPATVSMTLTLSAADSVVVAVPYLFTGSATLNLSINGFYLSQAIQRPDGSVPLVTKRDAYIRIFPVASEFNFARPDIRARFYHTGTLVDSMDIGASRSVPTAVDEATQSLSWNAIVPSSLIVPGLSVQVELDPANAIPESDNGDNVFPAGGSPVSIDVRALPALPVTLIPVIHGTLQGDVTGQNTDDFLRMPRQLYPIGDDSVTLHAPFTSTANPVEFDDANGAWGTTLSEIRALRAAESGVGYYYGVVQTTYSSGAAGLGFISSKAAVGWDRLPSGSEVMAHELGHNFGRLHAPCGNPPNPDAGYPHANADIGFFGIDLATMTLIPPTRQDVMSYCNNPWISDYTYEAVLTRRLADETGSPRVASRGLLVWGRVIGDSLVLEPAFEVDAAPYLPATTGSYRLTARDGTGAVPFDLWFEPDRVEDLPSGTEAHFAFVVPTSTGTVIESIELTGPRGRTAQRGFSGPAPALSVERITPNDIRVRWDATAHPMVMIQESETGEILGFGRGGDTRIATRRPSVRLTVSNGVGGRAEERTVTRRQ